jgi:LysM repeat protein
MHHLYSQGIVYYRKLCPGKGGRRVKKRCETLKLEHVVGEKSKQVVVQGDFHVPKPKPGIEKVISIDKTVKVTKKEIIKDKVIVEGYLNLQIVYVADAPGQPVHHMHQRLDFTQFVELEGAEPEMMSRVKVKVEDIQGKVKDRYSARLEVTAVLLVFVKVTELDEVTLMTSPPAGMEAVMERLRLEEVIAEGSNDVMISGKFRVPAEKPPVEKVLDVDASVAITDKKVIENKVIVEGDITLQIIYVADMATQPVHHMHQTLHFTQFIEVFGALTEMNVTVDETITHVSFDVVDPCTVSVEVFMDLAAKVTEPRELDVVVDLIGVDTARELLRVDNVVGEDHTQTNIKDEVRIPYEKPGVTKVLDVKIHKVEVLPEDIVIIKDKVIVSGRIDAQVLYVSDMPDQSVHHVQLALKFRDFISIPGAKADMNVTVQAAVEHVTGRPVDSSRRAVLEIVLKLTARVVDTVQIYVVLCEDIVEPRPPRPPKPPCPFKHVVQPGDTFWNLAQRYNVTVDSIMALNPGVDPLNIQIGSVLLIPCDP